MQKMLDPSEQPHYRSGFILRIYVSDRHHHNERQLRHSHVRLAGRPHTVPVEFVPRRNPHRDSHHTGHYRASFQSRSQRYNESMLKILI